MACPDLRATQGPEEEVGSLERACARFVPNFGPKAGRKWTIRKKTGRFNPGGPWVEFRDGLVGAGKFPHLGKAKGRGGRGGAAAFLP